MEDIFARVSIMLLPALFAVTCHEVSHGVVADRLGDNTARVQGRLTLNPLKHLDILGTAMVFLVGIGWAKPVPVDFRNLRHPKRDMIWVAAAGPVTNFLLALLSGGLLRLLVMMANRYSPESVQYLLMEPVLLMLTFSIYINLLLGVFNLFPVPPLDGGRVAIGLLPYRQAALLARVEPFGMIVIILLVFFTDIFTTIVAPVLYHGMSFLGGGNAEYVFERLFREILH